MPKIARGYSGTTHGSAASNGAQAVVFTPAQNANGTPVKDPDTK